MVTLYFHVVLEGLRNLNEWKDVLQSKEAPLTHFDFIFCSETRAMDRYSCSETRSSNGVFHFLVKPGKTAKADVLNRFSGRDGAGK